MQFSIIKLSCQDNTIDEPGHRDHPLRSLREVLKFYEGSGIVKVKLTRPGYLLKIESGGFQMIELTYYGLYQMNKIEARKSLLNTLKDNDFNISKKARLSSHTIRNILHLLW